MIKNNLKNRKSALYLGLTALCAGLALLIWINATVKARPPQPQGAGGVEVIVQVGSSNGQSLYSYQIINNSGQRVSAFRIGSAFETLQLVEPPRDWDFFTGIPAGSTASPAGWAANVITQQENNFMTLEWSTDDESETSGIQPGQSATGFSAIVATPDSSYQFTSFTADLGDGTMVSGPITQGGAVPTPTPPTPTPTPGSCNPHNIIVQRCWDNGGDWNWDTCRCEY